MPQPYDIQLPDILGQFQRGRDMAYQNQRRPVEDQQRDQAFGNAQDDRELAQVGHIAGYLAKLSPEQRAVAYQQVLPKLAPAIQKHGLPAPPPVWDESHLPELEQIAGMFGGAEKQSWQNLGNGYVMDGQGNTKQVYQEPQKPDQSWGYVPDPSNPENEVYARREGNSFFDLNGSLLYGGGQGAPQSPQNAPQGVMSGLMALGQTPGVTMTSGPRSPAHNAEVGGKENSQHLGGTAMDYKVPPQMKAQFIALAQKGGFQAIDEGDHIHLQLPKGGGSVRVPSVPGSRPRYKQGAEGGQYATLKPEEVKALGLPVGTVAQRSPNGQVQIVNKPKDLPVGGTVTQNEDGSTTFTPSGKLSDAQRNNAGFYDRMVNARKELDALEAKGYDPTNLRDYTTVGGKVLNGAATPEGQQYHQAAQNWVRANLRKESGAAIGVAEMDQEIRNYFPVFGDSPEVIKQKANNRKVVENAMRTAAGGAVAPDARTPAAQPAAKGPQDYSHLWSQP